MSGVLLAYLYRSESLRYGTLPHLVVGPCICRIDV